MLEACCAGSPPSAQRAARAGPPARPTCLLGGRRWTCWNSIFLIFWIQAHNTHPATGRWGELRMQAPVPCLGSWASLLLFIPMHWLHHRALRLVSSTLLAPHTCMLCCSINGWTLAATEGNQSGH